MTKITNDLHSAWTADEIRQVKNILEFLKNIRTSYHKICVFGETAIEWGKEAINLIIAFIIIMMSSISLFFLMSHLLFRLTGDSKDISDTFYILQDAAIQLMKAMDELVDNAIGRETLPTYCIMNGEIVNDLYCKCQEAPDCQVEYVRTPENWPPPIDIDYFDFLFE